jgi:GcpE protein
MFLFAICWQRRSFCSRHGNCAPNKVGKNFPLPKNRYCARSEPVKKSGGRVGQAKLDHAGNQKLEEPRDRRRSPNTLYNEDIGTPGMQRRQPSRRQKEVRPSCKASDVFLAVAAYQQLAEACDYPLRLGITEAGGLRSGTVKSSIGLGMLLWSGIGDTIRVSLRPIRSRRSRPVSRC